MKNRNYGLITDFKLNPDYERSLIAWKSSVVMEEGEKSISTFLTQRAAHILWYRLTQCLYPDQAPKMTALAGTAPLSLPDDPRVTINLHIHSLETGFFEILGRTPQFEWGAHCTESDAKRLWAKLDLLLFPVGWQGREALPNEKLAEKRREEPVVLGLNH